MRAKYRTAVLLVLATAVAGALAAYAAYLKGRKSVSMSVQEKKKLVYEHYRGDPWPKLGKPQPGDWLSAFDEPGQTLDEYKKSLSNRRTDSRSRIYLQPLGEFNGEERELLEDMREYSEAFFCCRTVLLEPVPMPKGAYNSRRDQYNASTILDKLKRRVPKDALSFSAITLKDLYVPDLNFVFGLASLSNRVGVYSLIRYKRDNSEGPTVLRRSVKVMSHEVGHVLGLQHCVFYRCGMCGSNSLAESDARPAFFCPLCLDKLRHNLGFDVIERYGKLRAYFEKHGMSEEAEFVEGRLEYLEGRGN
jgi:archaemetzincin